MSNLIKISKEYKDYSGSLWLGREIEIPPSENSGEAYKKAEAEMDNYFHSRGKPALTEYTVTDYNTGQSSIPIEDRGAKEKLEIAMDNAASPHELSNYWPDARRYGLQEHFKKRMTELSNTGNP